MRAGGIIAGVTAGLGLAGLESFNRSVRLEREKLEPQLPVEPTNWTWRYGNVAVYVAGNPSNPPLLLLHGQNAAASAFEMREPFARLADRFQVYVPDLLGYGRSDRPAIEYTPQLYVEFIEDILREVVGAPADVIASSLTSAYAIEAAQRGPEWIKSLVLICPTGLRRLTRQSPAGKALEVIFRVPVLGQAMYNGIASKPSIRYFLEKRTYHDPTMVTDPMIKRQWRTSHVPGAQYAPAAFVSGKLYFDISESWPLLEQPVLIVWGREAQFTPASDAANFVAANPAVQVEEISNAGNLPHDEQPEYFANVVGNWLLRL